METTHETSREATQLDQNDEVNRHATVLAAATRILISGLQPRNEDTSAFDALTNPYNADTPFAAQARLTAAAEAAQRAQNVGRLLAMREIDSGNLSQRTAATLLRVSHMTINRWYRAHKAEQVAEEQQQATD